MSDIDNRIDAVPVQYADLSSGRLAYRDAGQGTPVVFLHGIGSGSASWVLQFEAMAEHYRCIAWDAPGYGESESLGEDTPSVWDYVAVLREWIQSLGLDQYHLVAHSLGALTAGAHCQVNAELPRSLTFIDATLGYGSRPESERIEVVSRRTRTFDELGAQELAAKRGPALLSAKASDVALEIVRWNMSRLHRRGYHQAVHILAETDLLEIVGDIDIPVMVMCGTADKITPETLSKRLEAAYRHSSYVPLEGCGHAAYIEGAESVNRQLIERFERCSLPISHVTCGLETN